ncbi:MAG: hypothetical protein JW892_02020 [Anaerolineae bacterium]|nr:hypothetical protein [Anaerolineae bacterium]
MLYGALLWRRSGALHWGGVLLALNGVTCILGMIGTLTGSMLLSQGVMIGGILFLAALFPLGWGLWKGDRRRPFSIV